MGGNNKRGAKIEALVKAGADEKVTEFLTHIRKQYRNPVTHPEVVIEEHEAADLFVAALSAISMMLGATKFVTGKAQPSSLGLEALYGTAATALGGLQPAKGTALLGIKSGDVAGS